MMNIYMVNITLERRIHRSSHPKNINICHNPSIIWAPDQEDGEYSIMDEVNTGDIIVQYYIKGKKKHFIFGRAMSRCFPYNRTGCYPSEYGDKGQAIRIIDFTAPRKINSDIMEEVFKYMDELCHDVDRTGTTWVKNDIRGSGWEYDRSFIDLKGKDDMWRVQPGLVTIMEDEYIYEEIPLDKVGVLVIA